MNRIGQFNTENLRLALSQFLAGPVGTAKVVRGLKVSPTAPESMAVKLGAGAAIAGDTTPIIHEGEAILVVPAAHATLPRIDLVSIGYAEAAGVPEERWKINQATRQKFTTTLNTQFVTTPQPAITQGVPASSPAVPATPGGHIALATITVLPTATSIVLAAIGVAGPPPIADSDRLKAVYFVGPGGAPQIPPWRSNGAGGTVQIPPCTLAYLFASVYVQANGVSLGPLDFCFRDAVTGEEFGHHRAVINFEATVNFAGVLFGGTTRERIVEIQIKNAVTPGHASIIVPNVLTGPAGDLVVNHIGAVIL